MILGYHDDAVRSLEKVNETGVVISGSWDKSLGLWDKRSKVPCIGKFTQPEKIYTLDAVNNIVVVGMAARQIYIYDIRNLSETLQKRESSLKFMTRVVKCMPNGEGYASSSIEGRVAVEFFDSSEESQKRKYAFKCHREIIDGISHVYPVNALSFHSKFGTFASGGGDGNVYIWDGFNKKRLRKFTKYPTTEESQKRKYAFKCHREIIDGISHVYPVNALSFHSKFGTFASGGGDGNVYIWDGFNKKRLRKFTKYPTTISSLSFNSDGNLLAVASSYTFEEGEKDHPPDTIYIRSISDNEVKPKSKSK